MPLRHSLVKCRSNTQIDPFKITEPARHKIGAWNTGWETRGGKSSTLYLPKKFASQTFINSHCINATSDFLCAIYSYSKQWHTTASISTDQAQQHVNDRPKLVTQC